MNDRHLRFVRFIRLHGSTLPAVFLLQLIFTIDFCIIFHILVHTSYYQTYYETINKPRVFDSDFSAD